MSSVPRDDPRTLRAGDLEDAILSAINYLQPIDDDEAERCIAKLAEVFDKISGAGRESNARPTTKFILCDEQFCHALANDLAIAPEDGEEAFLFEPVKRAIKVAAWALDEADKTILENGGVHGDRSRIITDLIRSWSRQNHTGMNRRELDAPLPEREDT